MRRNTLGTYTFSSLDAFNAGTPSTYTQRIGDPLVEYFNAQTAVYVQDDIRVRKSLTLSPGVRYEIQTHLKDRGNIGPRMGVTWAPFKSGRTTLRASYGLFYNWLNANTYEQTLRVDGLRQRDLFIVNPTYPDPGAQRNDHDRQQVPARTGRADGPDAPLQRRHRPDDQPEGPRQRVVPERARRSTSCAAQNLNAPRQRRAARSGVRQRHPDRVRRRTALRSVVDDAERELRRRRAQRRHAARWNPRRTTFRVVYWIARANNNFDGPFVAPPSGTLATRMGAVARRSPASLPDRAELAGAEEPEREPTLGGNTGTPYNITTGFDNNNDSIFNDRPAGVGRNSARTSSQATVSANAVLLARRWARRRVARRSRSARAAAIAGTAAVRRPAATGWSSRCRSTT